MAALVSLLCGDFDFVRHSEILSRNLTCEIVEESTTVLGCGGEATADKSQDTCCSDHLLKRFSLIFSEGSAI